MLQNGTEFISKFFSFIKGDFKIWNLYVFATIVPRSSGIGYCRCWFKLITSSLKTWTPFRNRWCNYFLILFLIVIVCSLFCSMMFFSIVCLIFVTKAMLGLINRTSQFSYWMFYFNLLKAYWLILSSSLDLVIKRYPG